LQVDDELELGGLQDRQIGRLPTFKDAVDVAGSAAELVEPIGDELSCDCEVAHTPSLVSAL
jgi:hypothetical protein